MSKPVIQSCKCALCVACLISKLSQELVSVRRTLLVVQFGRCRRRLSTMAGPIVSTTWLKDELDKADANSTLIVFDTTWIPFRNGYDYYLKAHIPNAHHLDIKVCGQPTKEIPQFIPQPTKFEEYMQSFGVCNDSHIVLYDRDDGNKLTTCVSDRTWWILKLFGHSNVSVLDGGFRKWTTDGFPVAEGQNETKGQRGNFTCTWKESRLRSYEDMQKVVSDNSAQVVDCRLDVHFDGSLPEPNEFTALVLDDNNFPPLIEKDMIAGHMKNAKNIPFPAFKRPGTAEYLSKEEYRKLFEQNAVDLQSPVTATCYMGHTACTVALAAAVCGKDDVSVYAGSWTEWAQKEARVKEKQSPKL